MFIKESAPIQLIRIEAYMWNKNRQENFLMGISLSGVMMKAFYKKEEVVILDKSCDLVLVEFVKTKKTKWVREELIRSSH